MKIKFNLLQMLTMNSLNVKDQETSSNQLAFDLSVYAQKKVGGILAKLALKKGKTKLSPMKHFMW